MNSIKVHSNFFCVFENRISFFYKLIWYYIFIIVSYTVVCKLCRGRGVSVGTSRLSFDTSTQKVEGSIPGPGVLFRKIFLSYEPTIIALHSRLALIWLRILAKNFFKNLLSLYGCVSYVWTKKTTPNGIILVHNLSIYDLVQRACLSQNSV